MAKSDTGKIIALIGGLIGLAAVLASLLVNELGWWQIFGDNIPFFGDQTGFISSFGMTSNTFNSESEFIEEGALLVVGAVIVLISSILIILTAIKEEKMYSILCAIGIFVGLFVYCYGLTVIQDLDDMFSLASNWFSGTGTMFFGTATVLGADITWRLGNGFIIGVVGGIIAFVGAAIMD